MSSVFAVDGVLCISLVERLDRRNLLNESFSRNGLTVEFLLVDRDAEDPQRGCFDSHQRCAKIMLSRGWRRVLVLEDDVLFGILDLKRVGLVNKYISRFDPPVFYLGVMLGKLWPTWHRGIARCRAQGTHAYMINRSAAQVLASEKYMGQGVDTFLKRRFPGRVVYPMLCEQQPESVGKSDLDVKREPGLAKDEAYWARNRKKQHKEWLRNFYKIFFSLK